MQDILAYRLRTTYIQHSMKAQGYIYTLSHKQTNNNRNETTLLFFIHCVCVNVGGCVHARGPSGGLQRLWGVSSPFTISPDSENQIQVIRFSARHLCVQNTDFLKMKCVCVCSHRC